MILQDALKQVPFVRIVVPTIIGTLIAIESGLHIGLVLITGILLSLFIAYTLINRYFSGYYKNIWISGLFFNLLFLIIGFTVVKIQEKNWNKDYISTGNQTAIVEIIDQPLKLENSIRFTAKGVNYKDTTGWQQFSGKLLIYSQHDSIVENLSFGDIIIVNANISDINKPKNPYEFDYKKYLSNRQIYWQAYVQEDNVRLLSPATGISLRALSLNCRDYLLDKYRQYNIQNSEFAVLSALTLGYRAEIDNEIRQSYAASGAMHILAVSGLHVGILYLVMLQLLNFFLGKNKFWLIKVIVILGFLWFFAFLSGLSPSVMRAATMFSFIVIGRGLKRPLNIYNTLAASAFFLIILNPYIIMEVGFMLSYLAVIGIVYFQPKIYSLLHFNSFIPDKIWALIAVSIAAQIATFPISLLYFHQFPNYFFLTNIVVIPLLSIILYTSILFFLLSYLPAIAFVLSGVLEILVKSLNGFVHFIESLPGSVSVDIGLSGLQTILIYCIIVSIVLMIQLKNYKAVFSFLTMLIFLFCTYTVQQLKINNRSGMIVYAINRHTIINLNIGKESLLITSGSMGKEIEKADYNIRNHLVKSKIKNKNILPITPGQYGKVNKDIQGISVNIHQSSLGYAAIDFLGKKLIIFYSDELNNYDTDQKLHADFLILSNNVNLSLYNVMGHFEAKNVIIDSSNFFRNKEKWLNECYELGLVGYSTHDLGAYMIDI